MGNPLLVFWWRMFADQADDEEHRQGLEARLPPEVAGEPVSAGIFLVLRRMRAPLILLVVIFAVSVLGLTLMPGEDSEGRPDRLGIFEAFYFMSYTATTIGFGEIPHKFSGAQRMWVTFTIFLSVIGWAYAIGSTLALLQDRAFRRALARRHFSKKVAHLGEPFLLMVGYGDTARRLARSLDDMGRRFVVVGHHQDRATAVDLDAYRADTPALLADARETDSLVMAGLTHRHCEGVLALTGNDDTNLDVTMTTSLLRPGLPVIARTNSREVAQRMKAFGGPEVVNPLDRFGDHLRILLRSPASYQLMVWLTSAPGTPLPERRDPLPHGRWVVCGDGVFGRELTADLRAEGLEVTVLGNDMLTAAARQHFGTGTVDVEHAAALVAATENDTTNLWLVETARHANPGAFLVAMQNRASNSPLFTSVGVDVTMVPADVIIHEVVARLANPVLMRFLPRIPRLGEEWSDRMVRLLVERCGTGTPHLWRIALNPDEALALTDRLATGRLRMGDLLRSPVGREHPLDAVPLALLRDGATMPAPEDDTVLRPGDQLLIAGRPAARRSLDSTLVHEPTAAYVIEGRFVPSSWLGRRLAGTKDGRRGRQQSGQD